MLYSSSTTIGLLVIVVVAIPIRSNRIKNNKDLRTLNFTTSEKKGCTLVSQVETFSRLVD